MYSKERFKQAILLCSTAEEAAKKAEELLYELKLSAVERCFQLAEERILSLSQYDYEDWLASLIVRYEQPGYDTLAFNINDKNRLSMIRFIVSINNKLKGTGRSVPLFKIARHTIDTKAGFYLLNGESVIDCTIETLLANQKVSLTQELLKILFENQ